MWRLATQGAVLAEFFVVTVGGLVAELAEQLDGGLLD
jgi:hypothetical protein